MGRYVQPQRARQLGQRRHQRVLAAEHLDRDVVGAGVEVLGQPCGDRLGGAVATTASISLSLPGFATSSSVKPSRFQLFT